MLRFSDHFNINKPQSELDFVDIPLNTDIPLYIDAYAISIGGTSWYQECHQMVLDYFGAVVQGIKAGDETTVLNYMRHLGEPDETHFGVSADDPNGRGVGKIKAMKMYNALKASRAVQSGLVSEISDCELMIHGVGPDTISDIITNIIKDKLIDYTKNQCDLYSIPTEKTPSTIWSSDLFNWKSTFVQLPRYNNHPIILVPVLASRYYTTYSHDTYYEGFCLEYLKAEHWSAQDSLVRTFKDGTPRDVPKKWLREEYPINQKEFLVEFSEEHPDILGNYKKEAQKNSRKLREEDIEAAHRQAQDINLSKLITQLPSIETGQKDANKYEKLIEDILIGLFGGQIRNPVSQHRIHKNRKIIDITFENFIHGDDFFSELISRRKIEAPFVIFECKNYSEDIANEEFDQLLGRFGDHTGHFGIIVCRNIDNKEAVLNRCRDAFNKQRKYVIVLDDLDVSELIRLRSLQNSFESRQVDDYLNKKLDEVILN